MEVVRSDEAQDDAQAPQEEEHFKVEQDSDSKIAQLVERRVEDSVRLGSLGDLARL